MIKLELKICEGCGGTYIRRIGEASPYCVRCEQRFAKKVAEPVPVHDSCPRCLTGIDDNHDGDCGFCADLDDTQCAAVRAAIIAHRPHAEPAP